MSDRVFVIAGMRPVDRTLNAFARACDLGVEGAFYPFCEEITLRLNPHITPAQREQHADALKHVYEQTGHYNITITEVSHE